MNNYTNLVNKVAQNGSNQQISVSQSSQSPIVGGDGFLTHSRFSKQEVLSDVIGILPAYLLNLNWRKNEYY